MSALTFNLFLLLSFIIAIKAGVVPQKVEDKLGTYEDLSLKKENTIHHERVIFQSISDEALTRLCNDFDLTIFNEETNLEINCLEEKSLQPNEISQKIIKKRQAEELEGSGDDQTESTTKKDAQTNPTEKESSVLPTSTPPTETTTTQAPPPSTIPSVETTQAVTSQPEPTVENKEDDAPTSVGEKENANRTLQSATQARKVIPINTHALNVEKQPENASEIPKTAEINESKGADAPHKTSKDNSILLFLFLGVATVGTVAFAYNFLKKRKNRQAVRTLDVEASPNGKSVEMKPLMTVTPANNTETTVDEKTSDADVEFVEEKLENGEKHTEKA